MFSSSVDWSALSVVPLGGRREAQSPMEMKAL